MSIGKTLQALNQMVADGIVEQYAIAGAVAALNYIEPSVTEDLDILISFEIQPASSLVTIGPIVGYMASKGEGLAAHIFGRATFRAHSHRQLTCFSSLRR
jgi:hypothetical protein